MTGLFDKKYLTKQSIGIGFMLAHCFVHSLGDVFFKFAQQNLSIIQILFICNLLQCVTFLLLSKTGKPVFKLSSKNFRLHFLRSIFAFLAFLFCYYAISKIDVTEVRAIITIDPVVTVFLAIFFLKEKITHTKIIALIIATCGALILLHPSNITMSFPVLTALLSAFCFGIYNNITKKISNEKAVSSAFLKSLFLSIYSLVPAIYFWHPINNIYDIKLILVVFLLYLFSGLFSFHAFKNAEVSYLMPFHFLGVLFTAIWSYLFLKETVGLLTYIGSFIIILGTVTLFYKKAKKVS